MSHGNYVGDVLILLIAAVAIVPLFKHLGLGSILGYLAAGAVVGPYGLRLIEDTGDIQSLAELGVVFLLFSIGIELKPARLWELRRLVFGLGLAQVIITGLVLAGCAMLFGQPATVAVVIGFGLALSSTAFCLQILVDRGELNALHGRTAFSVLLLQDLAVVPLLAMVSMLSSESPSMEGMELALLEAGVILFGVIVAGRYLLTPALRLVARSRMTEVFTAAAVLLVLGTGWLMEEAGLSMALGAFLAGLMLANSQFRHQVMADIEPFRGLLLGLFFLGIGMSVNSRLLWDNALWYALLVPGLLLLKTGLTWVLCRLLGVNAAGATRASLLLSQSGEFGFVIFGLAAANGLISQDIFQFLALLIALTMLSTPLMRPLGDAICRVWERDADHPELAVHEIEEGDDRAIVAGFGRVGRRVARMLDTADIPYLVIESDIDRVLEGRQAGLPVYYGDAADMEVLRAAGAGRAGMLVCTLDKAEPAVRLVSIVREHYPSLPIHARGHDRRHCDRLERAGASIAISESLEVSLQLGEAALQSAGIDEEEAAAVAHALRSDYYR